MKLKYFEGGDISVKSKEESKDKKENKKYEKQIVEINKKHDKKVKEKNNELISNLNDDETSLYNIIKKSDKIHIDDIVEESNIKVHTAASILMQLEIKGIIKQLSGKFYTIEK